MCARCGANLGVGRVKSIDGSGLTNFVNKFTWLFWVSIIAIIGYVVVDSQHGEKTTKDPQPEKAIEQQKIAEQQKGREQQKIKKFSELPVPISPGIIIGPKTQAVAPLGIRTSAGSNYYIKLVNHSGEPQMTFFVRGGQYFETLVPLGTYQLRYASGKTWYGEKHRFGPETNYSKADTIFHFRLEGNRYSGYSVELIRQPNGNLPTSRISPDDF